ncbi:MAG: NUDIX domain-containing protein [Candidatus Dojkabacteria bacterium]|jgi:8-oxo-dGTP pyrophosphatase MutT (NUDIX family)|nr:NUDIX domain-containing protein [Candidatus Dojkabacteria bacterium]
MSKIYYKSQEDLKFVKLNNALLAVYILFKKGDKVLFVRRYNTGWMDGHYTLVAGHVRDGESLKQAAVREAKEEVNFDIKIDDLKLVHVIHRSRTKDNSEYIDYYFEVEKREGNIKVHDCIDKYEWKSFDDLPSPVIPVVGEVLDRIVKGEVYSEEGWED